MPLQWDGVMLKIGDVELESNLLLCPLAGYTDLTFRQLIRPLGGLGLAYTELVNPRGIMDGGSRSLEIVESSDDDRPLAIQLYGWNVDELAEASVWAAERGAVIVDINFGCPVPKVAGKGGGSGILRRCDDAVSIIETIVRRCPVPVTVKTRLGWEMGNLVAPALARRLEDVGVAAITIHGRYGMQKFAGTADWDGIAAVVENVRHIPIIGNGDIRSPEDAKSMLARTGCAGVMIGRHALGDPWIFRDTTAYLRSGNRFDSPSRLDRLDLMIQHFRMLEARKGSHRAVIEFRKRMAPYARHLAPCPSLRRGIPCAKSVSEWEALVYAFREELLAQGGTSRRRELVAS